VTGTVKVAVRVAFENPDGENNVVVTVGSGLATRGMHGAGTCPRYAIAGVAASVNLYSRALHV
jgi:hypothetical protein